VYKIKIVYNCMSENKEKLEIYKSQFDAVIDDYKKYFILTNKNPDYQEYSNFFSTINSNLTSINKELFVINNNIDKNTDVINTNISNLDKEILKEKEINKRLLFILKQGKGKENSSFIMIDDSINLYKYQYISNWNILIGIFILILVSYRLFHVNKKY